MPPIRVRKRIALPAALVAALVRAKRVETQSAIDRIETLLKESYIPQPGKDFTAPVVGMEFVWIDGMEAWAGKYEVTNAEYRKFNPAIGWSSFVVDANNRIASATGEDGACPEPGSDEYRNGLNYLDNCIQLTIEDGGPNDTDNQVNGIVTDPGTVGASFSDPVEPVVEEGSSQVSPWMLLVLTLLGAFGAWRRMDRGFSG